MTRTSEKTSLPGLRVARAVLEAHGDLEAPVLGQHELAGGGLAPAGASCSASERPKFTYIGSICVTVVSSTSGPETRLPSLFSARLVTPAIGDSTRVYARFRRASVQARPRGLHVGGGDLLGRTRRRRSPSARRPSPRRAASARRVARRLREARLGARRRSASARASAASKGAGSMRKSDWPARTLAPSSKLRFSRMPVTRARTSTSREPAVWAGNSNSTGDGGGLHLLDGDHGGREAAGRRAALGAAGGEQPCGRCNGKPVAGEIRGHDGSPCGKQRAEPGRCRAKL